MITANLSPSNRLYLTKAEADRLADQIRQELICRTATQADGPVVVADISLTAAEAWRLLGELEKVRPDTEIDWQNEGF
jgi:hypothetical protein